MPPFDIENNISDFMNLILSCMFYAPILPLAIPMCMIGIIFNYYFTKLTLAWLSKMPEDFGKELTTFFADFLPYTTIALVVSYFVFATAIYNTVAGGDDGEDRFSDLYNLLSGSSTSDDMNQIVAIINGSGPSQNASNGFLFRIAAAYTSITGDSSTDNTELWVWLNDSAWSSMVEIDVMFKDYAFVILGIVIGWLILPIRSLISCCKDDSELK